MKKAILGLSLLLSTSAYSKEYIVTFKKNISKSVMVGIGALKGVKSIEKFDSYNKGAFSRIYRVTANSKVQLKKLNIVEKVEDIHPVESMSIKPSKVYPTNDHFSNFVWGYKNSGQTILKDIDDIQSYEIHGDNKTDLGVSNILSQTEKMMKKEVIVAVIDSGIDVEHPDLKANIFKNEKECNEDGSINFKAKEDKDANGYVGDCMGMDFASSKDGSPDVRDDKGHGTHVAGIIAAVKGNNEGVFGLSNKIKILPIKVMKKSENLRRSKVSFTDRIAKAILYAVKMNASVINLSLGWPKALDTDYVREAIKEANNANVLIVAAAGNNNSNLPIYPCSYESVFCVGAVTADGSVASFSNYGGMVDILAPGDQILSTVPTVKDPSYFNVKGYDLKNGTSQAAPMVAAAGAFLQGLGESSVDKIKAKLLLSALSSTDKKYSNKGLMNLEKAMGIKETNIITPVFKDLSIIDFNMQDKTFSFSLPFKNYGKATSTKVGVSFINNPGIQLDASTFTLNKDMAPITVKGKVIDIDSKADLLLEVKVDGQSYKHNITIARTIGNSEGTAFDLGDDLQKIVSLKGGRAKTILRTVSDKYRKLPVPEYYTFNPKSKELNLYKLGEGSKKYVRQLSTANRILSVDRRDLNMDGKPDYLVRGLGKKDDQKHIIYAYLDNELNPLYPVWEFIFLPEAVVLPSKNISFVPVTIDNHIYTVPVFMSNGIIPEASRNPDPWEDEDYTIKMNHIYTFKPDLNSGEMKTHILDDYKVIEQWKEELNLKWYENVDIMGMFIQNEKTLNNGKTSFQISSGNDFYKSYYNVVIGKDLKMKVIPMNVAGENFDEHIRVSVTNLDDNKVKYHEQTALAGMQNDTLVHYFMLKDTGVQNNFSYDHPFKKDHILGVMASFQKNGTTHSFFQTKSRLVAKSVSESSEEIAYFPIHRVSFLPGNIFNELYYPVVAEHKKEKVPGFYIDAGQLHHGHLYVVKLTDDGLIAPIKNNIFVSKNCVSMNPVNYQGVESFSLLCKEKGRAVMKYLPMN